MHKGGNSCLSCGCRRFVQKRTEAGFKEKEDLEVVYFEQTSHDAWNLIHLTYSHDLSQRDSGSSKDAFTGLTPSRARVDAPTLKIFTAALMSL